MLYTDPSSKSKQLCTPEHAHPSEHFLESLSFSRESDLLKMATNKPNDEKAEVYQHEVLSPTQTRDSIDDAKADVEGQSRMDYSGAHEKTDPKEIALVRKLDWYIMPMLWLMYWLNYLDRNAIALARLDNLEEELNLQGSQYQTCVSILFVGYILGQVPSNMLITRLKP